MRISCSLVQAFGVDASDGHWTKSGKRAYPSSVQYGLVRVRRTAERDSCNPQDPTIGHAAVRCNRNDATSAPADELAGARNRRSPSSMRLGCVLVGGGCVMPDQHGLLEARSRYERQLASVSLHTLARVHGWVLGDRLGSHYIAKPGHGTQAAAGYSALPRARFIRLVAMAPRQRSFGVATARLGWPGSHVFELESSSSPISTARAAHRGNRRA